MSYAKDINHGLDERLYLRALSAQDFLSFGMHHIGYITHSTEEDLFYLCAADGSRLAAAHNHNEAIGLAHSHDLNLVRTQ